MPAGRAAQRKFRLNKTAQDESSITAHVLTRAEHCISRKNLSSAALRVLYRLHEAGYAALLVGGAVRDLLLGGHPKDFDVATDATPEEVRKLFRNCRLIGRRFRLAHVFFGPEIIEVATFRGHGDGDREIVDGRILRDNVWGSVEEDALRRDFRVNALYYDIADFSVRDYVGGLEDLRSGALHLIGDPRCRYREDPVRMLRAVRFAARLGFHLARPSEAPLRELGGLLDVVAPARLFEECLKLFLSGQAEASFHLLEHYDLLRHLLPGTVAALAQDTDGSLRKMIAAALANTDTRIAEGKPVTPAFLFAVFLWGDVCERRKQRESVDLPRAVIWDQAVREALKAQAQHVSIPRRFSLMMEDMWALQARFRQRSKGRVKRLLAHPRFRAAYDFLLLREWESTEIAELGVWWTQAQVLDEEALSKELMVVANSGKSMNPPPNRSRRRRRKAPPTTLSSSD